MPVKKPDSRPLFKVRCTHRIPIGPIGADRIIPIDIHPTNMDIMVPTIEGSSFKLTKVVKRFELPMKSRMILVVIPLVCLNKTHW